MTSTLTGSRTRATLTGSVSWERQRRHHAEARGHDEQVVVERPGVNVRAPNVQRQNLGLVCALDLWVAHERVGRVYTAPDPEIQHEENNAHGPAEHLSKTTTAPVPGSIALVAVLPT